MSLTENDHKSLDGLTYEQAFAELEKIVDALENEEHDLEKALALFERGQALSRHCTHLLEKAELKVQQISGEDVIDFPLPPS